MLVKVARALDVARAQRERADARSGERGAAAVEFALLVPLLIIVVFGIIAFGILFGQSLALNNAAREAARYGVVRTVEGTSGRTCADVLTKARQAASAIGMNSQNVAITVTVGGAQKCAVAAGAALGAATGSGLTSRPCLGTAGGSSDQLQVTAVYRSDVVIPLLPLPTFNLTGNGYFRCEYST